MPKNIVICSDGTGNTANKDRGTNVFKIFEAVDLHIKDFKSPQPGNSATISRQVTLYDDGVGSQSFILLKILGGAFGVGFKRNVKQLYTGLAQAYEPGDNIYVFGFSRGAFTVRTLVGFIANSGIPKKSAFNSQKQLDDLVKHAYKHYQQKYRSLLSQFFFPKWLENWLPKGVSSKIPGFIPLGDPYDADKYHPEPPVKFIGAWDTVDAVGLPFKEATEFWNHFIYRFTFRNFEAYEKTEKACHALSIDDERKTFHPVLWNEDRKAYKTKSEADWKREWIEQVWFPGVHSNVGGGLPKQGISLVTLHWMMQRAHLAGLMFIDSDWNSIRNHRNINDKLYKSRSGPAVYYRYKPRLIYDLCNYGSGKKTKVLVKPIKIHESLQHRIAQGTEGYAPGFLPRDFHLVANTPSTYNNEKSAAKKKDTGEFSKEVFAKLPGTSNSPLYEKLKGWVTVRTLAYYAFLGTSLYSVVSYFCALFSNSGLNSALAELLEEGGSIGASFDTISDAIEKTDVSFGTSLLEFGTPLLLYIYHDGHWVILLAAFGLSWLARKKSQTIRTQFWEKFR